jgi:putative ABC transport system ATP-binding protein
VKIPHADHTPTAGPAIRCTDLQRHFDHGGRLVRAVDGISLDVADGELLGIVGTSGSGKTTLLNLVGGLDTPTGGSLKVYGVGLQALDERGLARYRRTVIGIVFQAFHLIPSRTAAENVELPLMLAEVGAAQRRRDALHALEQVGLADRCDHRPDELSGGEQQRVALARALVRQPRLLLADEPTGNLDSRTSEDILDLIARLHRERGLTVLLVSHDVEAVARIATRHIRLHDGLVVGNGGMP